MPIIFMTGHGDVPMTVRAMKAGAVDFLTKPFRDQDMLDAVAGRPGTGSRSGAKRSEKSPSSRDCYATLTPREQEVMGFVTKGLMNKQVAGEIG